MRISLQLAFAILSFSPSRAFFSLSLSFTLSISLSLSFLLSLSRFLTLSLFLFLFHSPLALLLITTLNLRTVDTICWAVEFMPLMPTHVQKASAKRIIEKLTLQLPINETLSKLVSFSSVLRSQPMPSFVEMIAQRWMPQKNIFKLSFA